MSDNNVMGGWDGLIGLLIVASLFGGNGCGGGLFGNRGNCGNAAAETAMLMQQDNTRATVAASGAKLDQVLGQTGGIIEMGERIGDKVDNFRASTDTNLCQLGNNLARQIHDLEIQMKDCCCRMEQVSDRNADRILAWQNTERQRQADLRIAQLEAEKSNAEQTAALKAYIDEKFCCAPRCGSPCNNGCGNIDTILALMLKQNETLNTTLATIASKIGTSTTTAA